MYTGKRTHENGRIETEDFDTYEDLIKWLADDLTCGVSATVDGRDIKQGRLTEDIQSWCS